MAGLGRVFLRGITVLAMALGIWLGLQGTAVAVECSDKLDPGWPQIPVTNPDAADRQAIMDLIHTYYWILDDKDSSGVDETFPQLFTADVAYEACRTGGQVRIAESKARDALIKRTKDTFIELNDQQLRTRHFVSNALLHDTKKGVVEGKFTLLVTLQRAASADVPETDYTASVKVRFSRKEDDKWKFVSLTLITDTPEVEERAR